MPTEPVGLRGDPLSPVMAAQGVIGGLIIRDGRSYADAIRVAEREAAGLAAPYREVAAEIRHWLEEPHA